MFVTITRRVLIAEKDLPFPESVAAAEIHKAGQGGAKGTGHLLAGMGLGALFTALTEFKVVAAKWQQAVSAGKGSLLLRGPEIEPGLRRRRLYHRAEAGLDQLQRRDPRLGPPRPGPGLLPELPRPGRP